MFRFIRWLFAVIFTAIMGFIHVVADVILFCARWVFIAAVFGLAAMLVVQYAHDIHYGNDPPEYQYQSYIEGKVGVLQGETKALLVRFDVTRDDDTVVKTRAFLTPEQVLQLEELPTLTFTETGPGCYRIEELQVTTKRF